VNISNLKDNQEFTNGMKSTTLNVVCGSCRIIKEERVQKFTGVEHNKEE
jgi:hypothetical protein